MLRNQVPWQHDVFGDSICECDLQIARPGESNEAHYDPLKQPSWIPSALTHCSSILLFFYFSVAFVKRDGRISYLPCPRLRAQRAVEICRHRSALLFGIPFRRDLILLLETLKPIS